MTELPPVALSIRQPWAWAILNAGKDIENRSWPTIYRGPVCIHAAIKMPREDFDGFVDLARAMKRVGTWPNDVLIDPPETLERGGIVGTANVVDCVTSSASPWFFGTYGFVLRDVRPVEFIPCRGKLGLFKWMPDEGRLL